MAPSYNFKSFSQSSSDLGKLDIFEWITAVITTNNNEVDHLQKRGLLKTFEIPPGILLNFLLHLEHHYRDNPYHNQIHAADVAQSVNVLISSAALQVFFLNFMLFFLKNN